ncbi:MAG: putative Bkd operon transcriptional regulator [Comamonadaceae bacterium]|nr:MAG: putative Bkd operon transcriptional regulator [Comamonadaceae bacterium]
MHNSCMKKQINEDFVFDRFDVALLDALQKDASLTHQQLGEAIHLSASQVSRRVARLQAAGIIRRSVALLDAARVGLGVRAIIYVSLVRHGGEEGLAFEREMAAFPEVLACDAVAGESDYILQIVAASLSDLSDSVLRRLTRIQGVNSIRSNIVLQSIKSSTELPLTQCF